MKIAMISINAGPPACLGGVEAGGQSVVIDSLARELSIAGHDVSIVTQRDDPAVPSCLVTACGVHVDAIAPDPRGSSAALDLAAVIEAFRARLVAEWALARPDVVHAHSWMSGKAAIAAARPFGIPVVQTFHGLASRRRDEGRRAAAECHLVRLDVESELVRQAARIIATSSAEVFTLLEMGANPGAIKFIPCGVDLTLFRPVDRPAPRPGEPLRLATLSRLVPDAGVGDVIAALAHVEGVQLAIGGGRCDEGDIFADPDAGELAAFARARGLAERVMFRGRVKREEVAAFLQSADVVVCAPWYDSIGTVALEAMACGVPVIVSAVGGHVDAVADGLSGTHVPPQAPRQIAYAIEALRTDASRRTRFSRFGAERTRSRHGWPRIAAETLDVYGTVAAHTSARSRSHA